MSMVMLVVKVIAVSLLASFASALVPMYSSVARRSLVMASTTSTSTTTNSIPSWADLKAAAIKTPAGQALEEQVALRKSGEGGAHVQSTLRTFGKGTPDITLFRDHAGWCPYCQKTMLLIEEKEIPMKIELVPMRSYGDKPREFLQKVPSGLLPAIQVDGQIITESGVIMELLDKWHTAEDGYKEMMPKQDDVAAMQRYSQLARLERELFSWWCTLVFRPDSGSMGGISLNPFAKKSDMSSSMQGFLDCAQKVNDELNKEPGPWFFGNKDHPTMIDFIYVSHVERMLASVAFWKGLDMRDPKWGLGGITDWLKAFEKRESYLAFKSDYYTHVKDIPPQYGPGYDGGFEADREKFSKAILGRDGSWTLPLPFDDSLQPLYYGPPLPQAVLESMSLTADADGTYLKADPAVMEMACRYMAAWKLASNGVNVSRFAARGGPKGSKNPRKSFGAQLADPYADPDDEIRQYVDAALRFVCQALLDSDGDAESHKEGLTSAVPKEYADGVIASLAYLRDRTGVPRDLPLASARYLRAYLNHGIAVLSS